MSVREVRPAARNRTAPTPVEKAADTAKWAKVMTKWLVTYSRKTGSRWEFADLVGPKKGESRGVVDLVAIRKAHRDPPVGLKRGDLFEIVLIQVKGGGAPRCRPTGT